MDEKREATSKNKNHGNMITNPIGNRCVLEQKNGLFTTLYCPKGTGQRICGKRALLLATLTRQPVGLFQKKTSPKPTGTEVGKTVALLEEQHPESGFREPRDTIFSIPCKGPG